MAEVNLIAWLLLIPLAPYLVLLLYITKKLSIRQTAVRGSLSPVSVSVSVIIPCRDEETRLPDLLNDLAAQDFNHDNFEVVVVDDNSVDNTSSIVTAFKGLNRLMLVKNPGRGKKTAIKNGISSASGELIITTDADCRVAAGWIGSITALFTEKKPDLIISPVVLAEQPHRRDWFQQLEFLSLQAITAGSALAGRPVLCNGANLAFPVSVYNENSDRLRNNVVSGDDIFLLQSIRRSGGRIVWNGAADSVVHTAGARGLIQFLKQRARWLSKAGSYHDTFTIILALVSLFTSVSLASLLVGSIPVPSVFPFWLAAFILKSIPDFLLLYRITSVYKKTNLLWWFIPSQVFYPFYVLLVSVYSLFRRNRW